MENDGTGVYIYIYNTSPLYSLNVTHKTFKVRLGEKFTRRERTAGVICSSKLDRELSSRPQHNSPSIFLFFIPFHPVTSLKPFSKITQQFSTHPFSLVPPHHHSSSSSSSSFIDTWNIILSIDLILSMQ